VSLKACTCNSRIDLAGKLHEVYSRRIVYYHIISPASGVSTHN